ncbi:MAG: ferritin-like domain-containing protein [Pseudonocardia sp.]|nr:ferritin-like domain-containing protein [Pseudonocardia sp.]
MAPTRTASALNTGTLITQLRALEQLTQTEIQIARVRVAQARTDAVRRELVQNGDNAVARARRISEQMRDLDALPDVVTPAIGRVLAFVKSTVEQAQPIDEALLGDLALEHQLLDRALYVRVLAQATGHREVERLADDLVTAHTATVEWLGTVIAEEALGGPVALSPTPLQRVAGSVTWVVGLPTRFAVARVNRAVHIVSRTGESARGTAEELADRAVRLGTDTREVAMPGRDAALQRAERVARRDGTDETAGALHQTRTDLGTLTAAELPVKDYEEMTTPSAIAAIRRLSTADDLRAMVAFEENHKNRSGVVSAAQTRYAGVAKNAAELN